MYSRTLPSASTTNGAGETWKASHREVEHDRAASCEWLDQHYHEAHSSMIEFIQTSRSSPCPADGDFIVNMAYMEPVKTGAESTGLESRNTLLPRARRCNDVDQAEAISTSMQLPTPSIIRPAASIVVAQTLHCSRQSWTLFRRHTRG
jgi:hypothetical protein